MTYTNEICPTCHAWLVISWDMWGEYYLCNQCGFTAEDDDDLQSPVDERIPLLA